MMVNIIDMVFYCINYLTYEKNKKVTHGDMIDVMFYLDNKHNNKKDESYYYDWTYCIGGNTSETLINDLNTLSFLGFIATDYQHFIHINAGIGSDYVKTAIDYAKEKNLESKFKKSLDKFSKKMDKKSLNQIIAKV